MLQKAYLISSMIFLAQFLPGNSLEVVLRLTDHRNQSSIQNISSHYNLKLQHRLFDDYFVFEVVSSNRTRLRRHSNHQLDKLETKLRTDALIKWHAFQTEVYRTKRSVPFRYHNHGDFVFNKEMVQELNHYFQHLKYAIHHRMKSRKATRCQRDSRVRLNDPEWHNQWYINDGCSQGYNLNITNAWAMGYTGRNVVVSIIDDGLETTNPELAENYDPQASHDFNDDDMNPEPRYERTNENKHGTRCAGEIAAKGNNSICGVGVAFNCRIGGIRLLDGKVTDRLEAEALSFNTNYIDVFSASWGPLDDGRTVDGPGVLARQALKNGIEYGRNGKGTIYVWAAGNGGRFMDNCNCDGYTSSVYTITVGGIKRDGGMPVYSERCSSILASTFTSGSAYEIAIVTPDIHNKCTRHHSGTSASAPIAAGIIALALEANPSLTWRDIQYLIIITSSPLSLKAADWKLNGIGRYISHNYGFGLINAGRLVEHAVKWPLVERQLMCEVYYLTLDDIYEKIAGNFMTKAEISIGKQEAKVFSMFVMNRESYSPATRGNLCDSTLAHLEHVTAVISLASGERGKILINLISPSNTTSNLLELRKYDASLEGFKSWPFMSVHFWGESVVGLWRLEVINLSDRDLVFKEWFLRFYGTDQKNPYL